MTTEQQNIEELCMTLGSLLADGVSGVERLKLAQRATEAASLLKAVGEAHAAWFSALQAEIRRQSEAESAVLVAAGLVSAPAAAAGGGKRGRKPRAGAATTVDAESAAKARVEAAVTPAVTPAVAPEMLDA